MKSLVGVSKWGQKATEGIELHLGDVVLGAESEGIKLNRNTPNMLIAGTHSTGLGALVDQMLAFAVKGYDPSYFNLAFLCGKGEKYNNGIFTAKATKKSLLFEDAYPAFCSYLEAEIEERTKALVTLCSASIEDFNSKNSAYLLPIPRLLVVVENFDVFSNIDRLLAIMRRSASVGIHFIFTTEVVNDLLYRDDFMSMFPIKVCTRATKEMSSAVLGSCISSEIRATNGFCYSKTEDALSLWHYHHILENDLIDLYRKL